MRKAASILFAVVLATTAATIYRSDPGAGGDLGLMPVNAPNVGDVLAASASGTIWTNLSVQQWTGTTGNALLGIGTSTFFQPNNSNATLLLADAAGVTRTPVTRATILRNLFVVVTPAPGSGKTTTVIVMTNGVASALTASVAGTATNANDTTHTVTVAAGTEIGVKIVTAASSVGGKAAWAFEGR